MATAGEWTATMTHSGELEGLRATGRRVSSAGVDVATLDDQGRISHLISYYDGAEIMRELGLLPRRGSRLEQVLLRAASLRPHRP
jgi:predicted ester cyclase